MTSPVKIAAATAVILCAGLALFWGLNRPASDIDGKWKIVSVWGTNMPKLDIQELRPGTVIEISPGGYLRAGRAGFDGILSANLLGSADYRMVQSGNGFRFTVKFDRVWTPPKVMVINSDPENEVIVATRIPG